MFLVRSKPMIKVNIHEAKAKLSEYLAAVEQGETVIVCRRNLPIAEIRPVHGARTQPRPLGLAPDQGAAIPPEFWEPLPEEMLKAFSGETDNGTVP
jgi:prevent-host-death family protein